MKLYDVNIVAEVVCSEDDHYGLKITADVFGFRGGVLVSETCSETLRKELVEIARRINQGQSKEEKFKEIIDSIERKILELGDYLESDIYEAGVIKIFKEAKKELKEAINGSKE